MEVLIVKACYPYANVIAQHPDGEIAAMHSEQHAEGGTVVYVGRVAKKGKRQHLLIGGVCQNAAQTAVMQQWQMLLEEPSAC